MRLLAIGYLPPRVGGAAMSVGQIFSGVARAGAEVAFIAAITPEHMQGCGDWYAARNPAVRVLRYLMPTYHFKTYEPLPPELAELERHQVMTLGRESAKAFKPDLLVGGHEFTGSYARALAAELGLPWCQLLRGSPTGQILGNRFDPTRTGPFLDQLRAANRIIAVSRFMADGLAERFAIDDVRTVANAIDLARFKPMPASDAMLAHLGIERDAQIVLSAGTLIGRKRPLDILRAAVTVIPRHPKVRFVFAGAGELEADMRAFITGHGLEEHVRLVGHIDNERMHEVLACAQIAVMASEAEGMSRSFIEAMACGVPLVAADNLAACELIDDGCNGRLFSLGDVDQLAAILGELLDSPESCKVLGRSGLETVAERDITIAIESYLREFGAAIKDGR